MPSLHLLRLRQVDAVPLRHPQPDGAEMSRDWIISELCRHQFAVDEDAEPIDGCADRVFRIAERAITKDSTKGEPRRG